MDLEAGSVDQVWDPGITLLDLSPDGKSALVFEGRSLYVIDLDGTNPDLITSRLPNTSEKSFAYWMQTGEIVFIGVEGAQKYIYLLRLDGSDPLRLSEPGGKPYRLIPSTNTQGVAWVAGWEEPKGAISDGVYWTSVDGETIEVVRPGSRARVSPSGELIAFVQPRGGQLESGTYVPVDDLGLLDLRTMGLVPIPTSLLGDFVTISNVEWLPDEHHLTIGGRLCEVSGEGRYGCLQAYAATIDLEGTVISQVTSEMESISSWYLSKDGQNIVRFEIGNTTQWEYPEGSPWAGEPWETRYKLMVGFQGLLGQTEHETEVSFFEQGPRRMDPPLFSIVYSNSLIWLSAEEEKSLTQSPDGASFYPPASGSACDGSAMEPPGFRGLYVLASEGSTYSRQGLAFYPKYVGDYKLVDFALISTKDGIKKRITDDLIIFDGRNGSYSASVVLGGRRISFHGQSRIEVDPVSCKTWIQLDDNVPSGVDDKVYPDETFAHFTWGLPPGGEAGFYTLMLLPPAYSPWNPTH